MASTSNAVDRPRAWSKAVQAALWRLSGLSQAEAGDRVGVTARTVRRWEASPWWQDALDEAAGEPFLKLTDVKARKSLWRLLDADDPSPQLVQWWFETRWPAQYRQDQTLRISGEVNVQHDYKETLLRQIHQLQSGGPAEPVEIIDAESEEIDNGNDE